MKLGLAFYTRPPDSAALFRELSLRGLRRASLISRSGDDRIQVRKLGPGSLQWVLFLISLGILVGIILGVGFQALLLIALLSAGLGWIIGRRLGSGVSRRLVRQYQRWVLRDETLVLVDATGRDLEQALQVFQSTEERFPAIFFRRSFPSVTAEQPSERREPIAGERLKSEASRLASTHRLGRSGEQTERLLRIIDDYESRIKAVVADLNESLGLEQAVSPAAEWLLDNSYVVQAHISDFRLNLPRKSTRFLPVLAAESQAAQAPHRFRSESAGPTRIEQVARELVLWTDSRLNRDNIIDFVQAYQSLAPLTIAELWLLPLMLRFALIEQLQYRAVEIARRQQERELADFWANRLLHATRRDADQLLLVLAELVRETPVLQRHFAVRLIGRLHDEEAALSAVQNWVEREFDTTLQEVIRQEQNRQAVDKVSVANGITSLRFLGETDWRDIFESLSRVDTLLRSDPSGTYAQSDFKTRDRCRQAVEEIARLTCRTELDVAALAVKLAISRGTARDKEPPLRGAMPDAEETDRQSQAGLASREVGPKSSLVEYYLIDEGRVELESAVKCPVPVKHRLLRFLYRQATPIYLGAIVLLTACILGLAIYASGLSFTWVLVLIALLGVFPSSEIAVQIINYLISIAIPPRLLPKLSFRKGGVPDQHKTLVIVPMVLLTPDSIRTQLKQLEVNYLANPERNLLFGLLSDFPDAPAPTAPEDNSLYEQVFNGIRELNEKYEKDVFYLFHRDRVWSESEQRWMGWERKRGKLEELNCLLNQEPHPFEQLAGLSYKPQPSKLLRLGSPAGLKGVRYVLTLDADTDLPPGTALRMIETLAHPLNQPNLREDGSRVESGYAIIQPRVSAALPDAIATRFTRLFSDPGGTDPYTPLVSDAYQDLFGDSIYHGKAIYDVRAFHRILSGRFPPETLLSHDLIEGCYLRVGLASDIEILESFPHYYHAWMHRFHRWIRGDWQILSWILPRVPVPEAYYSRPALPESPSSPAQQGEDGVVSRAAQLSLRKEPNPLSVISRWKILDNLRRSLVAPASLGLLVGAFVSDLVPFSLVILVVVGLFAPALIRLLDRAGQTRQLRIGGLSREFRAFLRCLIDTAFLPVHAWVSLDAIVRVAFRRLVSRRHLLEWETAQVSHWMAQQRVNDVLLQTGLAGIVTCLLVLYLAATQERTSLFVGLPFFILWVISPVLADLLASDRVRVAEEAALSAKDKTFLRLLARKTWRYFDDLIGPRTNWLPPDNSQEALRVEVAERTSPTNIGLALVSTVAAYDFGYLTVDQLVERTRLTLETIGRLERYEGHLLNWYDTRTLEPLRPPYVSTVDSGNLLACYIVLDMALGELRSRPLLGNAFHGLRDTFALIPVSTFRDSEGLKAEYEALADVLETSVSNDLQAISVLRTAKRRVARLVERIPGHADVPGSQLSMLSVGTAEDPLSQAATAADEGIYWVSRLVSEVNAWNAVLDRYLSAFERLGELVRRAPAGLKAIPQVQEVLAESFTPSLLQGEEVQTLLDSLASNSAALPELEAVQRALRENREAAFELEQQAKALSEQIHTEMEKTDLRFLYDANRRLFAIGYNPALNSRDNAYYDLLASEARLASLIAISRGEVPPRHWSSLARPFGRIDSRSVLLSWSGTMFEYLMPLLFTQAYRSSLLDHASRQAVLSQIEYGRQHRVPWGISESAFSALDSRQIYQYRAFGVPGLALKREADTPPVVAPYATALALMVFPKQAIRNLRLLTEFGLSGNKGLYEAIDFTRESEREGKRGVVIHAYMAHHQGMSLVAIDNVINRDVMRHRFHQYPRIKAVESLLFEGVPAQPPILLRPVSDRKPVRLIAPMFEPGSVRISTPDTRVPRIQAQSNGSYHLMITNSGGGYIRWTDFDVTRWRADATQDGHGSFCYIRDCDSGNIWSTSFHPLNRPERRYSVTYSADRIEFRRRDHETETLTQIVVSPEDDAEIRLITLTNRSLRTRRFQLTSYTELALCPHSADVAHPGFQKLFIQTEGVPEKQALLAWRRLRAPDEKPIWAGHLLAGRIEKGSFEYETDREAFLGRGLTPGNAVALNRRLSGRSGFVLDPIFSARGEIRINPGGQARLAFITVCGESRERVEALIDKYRDLNLAERALELAWTRAQLQFRYLSIQADQAQQFMELASHIVYPNDRMRSSADRLRQNRLGQSNLWGHGLSGDLPIVLVTVSDSNDLPLVRETLLAHAFWAVRGIRTDLIVLNYEAAGYTQPLNEELRRLIHVYSLQTGVNQPGGIHLLSAEQMPAEDLNLLYCVSRVILAATRGSLSQQLRDSLVAMPELPPPIDISQYYPEEVSPPLRFMELDYFNGLGGFAEQGREYVIYLGSGEQTPAPWSNVLANSKFGTLVTESGIGSTWCENSQSNRLTPWANDPVSNPPSEAIFIRDDDTGASWTPTPLPIRELDPYRVRHGQGYSVFEHNSHAIEQELTMFVPTYEEGGEPIRVGKLRLRNSSSRRRRLTVTSYYDVIQGTDREDTQMHVVTNWDPASSSLLARNSYQPHFKDNLTFVSMNPSATSYSGDRALFLGLNRSLAAPVALQRQFLPRRSGAGLDPCLALQTSLDLRPGEEREIILLIGQATTLEQARALIARYRDPLYFEEALAFTKAWWDRVLRTIEVKTPEKEVDTLLNGWLMYQTLACRIWARSAFYQSGGAYGFRDQLQDMMAAVYVRPAMVRDHILLAASRQFQEGDVQHWWHQVSGAGVRTRCSDDMLWLPYVVGHYVEVTGDEAILDARVPFLEGPPLKEGEQEAFFTPAVSIEDATLFEHCVRAVRKASQFGIHGLPLMGSGDWNDGMNRVGVEGRGESVWLGWFFIEVLKRLTPMCEKRGETTLLEEFQELGDRILAALESHGWDGNWYRRAYFDDGTPLGSHTCSEARIDSLPQSWAAIALGATQRSERAIAAVNEHLVDERDKLVLLFDPPFDKSTPHPGYIMGYPPGVRENGGQYTHGALWVALAHARLGDGARAAELLRLMSPLEHTRTPEDVLRYKAEPYVVPADVYALEGRRGRAGWTWYTGSSGWMYRIWIEEILGFKLRGDRFCFEPCLPPDWKGFSFIYNYEESTYTITVENPDGVSQGVASIEINGQVHSDKWIPLRDNGRNNRVVIRMGREAKLVSHG